MNNPMDDPHGRGGWLQLGVAAQLAKRYGEDERDFLKLLALLLQSALPEATRVERGGWPFNKNIRRVTVALDENVYALEDTGHGPLVATRVRIVRGIKLKNESLPVAQWIADLGVALEAQAKASAEARDALSRLLDN